jgi:addiction module RelE/StbE family toxin
MIKVGFSSSFKRAFKKKISFSKDLEGRFWGRLELFMNNPYDAKLKTHKLSGELKDLWSFSIEYDIRVLFLFVSKNKVLLVDIGTHDEVY